MSPKKRNYFSRVYIFQPLIFRGHSLVFRGVRFEDKSLLKTVRGQWFQGVDEVEKNSYLPGGKSILPWQVTKSQNGKHRLPIIFQGGKLVVTLQNCTLCSKGSQFNIRQSAAAKPLENVGLFQLGVYSRTMGWSHPHQRDVYKNENICTWYSKQPVFNGWK